MEKKDIKKKVHMVFLIGEHIICSNVGDSRKDVIPLSEDQKPKHKKEKKRIEEKGGEIRN